MSTARVPLVHRTRRYPPPPSTGRPQSRTPGTEWRRSEHRDDVLGADVRGHIDTLDVEFGHGRELDAPPLHDHPDLGDRAAPVLRLFLEGQHAETGVPGVTHQ